MKTLDHAASLIQLLPVLAVPAWSAGKLVRGVRAGRWQRPGWFGRAAWTSLLIAVLAWLRGLFSGGLDSEDACKYWNNQPWDDAYRQAHHDDWFRLFPLSNKCNAAYDLVPAWVNPTVAVFFLVFVASVAGVVWTSAQRTRERRRRPS